MAKANDIPEQYTADFLERLDGRTRFAQVVQQRFRQLTDDMGGLESLSYQRRALAKRIIHLECLIEQQEQALARGQEVDAGKLTNTTNTLIGLLKTVGLDRAARDVPDLATYLKKREAIPSPLSAKPATTIRAKSARSAQRPTDTLQASGNAAPTTCR